MRHLLFLTFLASCTGSTTPVAAPAITFEPTQATWKLTALEGAKTHMALQLGESTLDFGIAEGTCAPTADLPFTEVQGQKAFAALQCGSPDGGTHHVVVLEVLSPDDPEWPQPVALAMVMARTTADDKVTLLTLGAVEVPLGVVPLAPIVPAVETKPADPL